MKAVIVKALGGLGLLGLFSLLLWADPSGRYFNVSGLFLVVAGTFAATVLAHSFRGVTDLLRRLRSKLGNKASMDNDDLDVFLRVVEAHRQGAVRAAEQAARRLQEPLLRAGAELVINRTPQADLTRMLQWKIGAQRERDQAEIQIIRTMGTFAPAFGMLGTLFGLIEMMYGLDANRMEQIGEAMGFAMLTTVYGLVLTNLVLKPIATRLERRAKENLAWSYVQMESVLMLHDRCHSAMFRDYWQAFFDQPETNEPIDSLPLSMANS
ncbi:motility protein A [Methylocaldum sp.]|uniref:motility protein A n=1 Tax=Methylocaldum sp. TaxID=1969727 RepID=UPI002D486814|nr:MotA/TolQ/ExbB proton channel family protein [Methylocaldum sp.]HYE36364.1 MotA/TolQ/ExbB proton channel family protein [Methylocaldum sp.]